MTVDELAKLAVRHNTVILHLLLDASHCYLVQSHGATHRYVLEGCTGRVARLEASQSRPVLRASGPDYVDSADPSADELFGYGVHRSGQGESEATDTIILQRIRL